MSDSAGSSFSEGISYPADRDIEGLTSRIDLDEQYGGLIALNLQARWNLYRYTEDGRDIHAEVIAALKLQGNEGIVDIGCGDGSTYEHISREHTGILHGVDLSVDPFLTHKEILDRGHPKAEFIHGELPATELPSRKYDIAMALFVLYHLPDPIEGILELRRVTKESGRVVIATSGPLNKYRHRKFEKEMAEVMGIEPPPIFAGSFSTYKANDLLNAIFGKDNVISDGQCSPIIISDEEGVQDYIASLNTMRASFKPRPSAKEWNRIIESLVLPSIWSAIEDKGQFVDIAERRYYICRNRK